MSGLSAMEKNKWGKKDKEHQGGVEGESCIFTGEVREGRSQWKDTIQGKKGQAQIL